MPYPLFMAGRWDEALERAGDMASWDVTGEMSALMAVLPTICVNRGLHAGLQKLEELSAGHEGSSDVQRAGGRSATMAVVREAEGNHAEALELAKDAVRCGLMTGADSPLVRIGFAQAVDSGFALGDLAEVEEVLDLLGGLRRGEVWPSLVGLGERTNARLAAARGTAEGVEIGFTAAAEKFREIGMPYWLAATLTEHAEWSISEGRSEEAGRLLAEAREIFEQLQARPWLDRLDRIQADATAVLTAG